jgi:hypothetical protein
MADSISSGRSPIVLRAPHEVSKKLAPPSLDWLAGKWNVTHSTLPMWKSKRNVTITYTPLPAAGAVPAKVDDLVQYEPVGPPWRKVQPSTVHGVDTALPEEKGWGWKWRGKGLLAIASSRWEVLGYGDEPTPSATSAVAADTAVPKTATSDAPKIPTQDTSKTATEDQKTPHAEDKRQWVVTYFASTLFTPAGIDVYSRHPDGVKPETLQEIKAALAKMEDPTFRRLAGTLFEVEMKRDESS